VTGEERLFLLDSALVAASALLGAGSGGRGGVPPVVVMEDLGPGASVATALLGADAQAAG
jgi:hypothetical protein